MREATPGVCAERGLLLIGGAREKVARLLSERQPGVSAIVHDGESARPGGASTILLCPADPAEERSLPAMDLSALSGPGAIVCTILQHGSSATLQGPPGIVLRHSAYACDLLLHLFALRFPPAGREMIYRLLSMAMTGLLLPYFIHNMNNMLTRVMGNAELAGLQLSDAVKARSRIDSALEGAEELRGFLGRLADRRVPSGRAFESYRAGDETPVLEMGRMSSGTSVEFRHSRDASFPEDLDVDRSELNALLACLSSAATLCVNGSGTVSMDLRSTDGEALFSVAWSCNSAESLHSEQAVASALAPLSLAAVLAPPAGLTFRLGEWDRKGGSASLGIPVEVRAVR